MHVLTTALCRLSRQALLDNLPSEHWADALTFRTVEEARRVINSQDEGQGHLFLSHCWRKPDVQSKKRRLIAQLSLPKAVSHPAHPRSFTLRLLCLESSIFAQSSVMPRFQ